MADKKKPFIITNFRAVDMPKRKMPTLKNQPPKESAVVPKNEVEQTAQQGSETLSAKPKASRKGKK